MMAKLNQAMKDLIAGELSYIATVDADGNPDVGPKISMRVLDDEHLIYNEMTGGQTQANINDNGKVIVATANAKALKGFRFGGTAKLYTDGPYYEQAEKWAEGKFPVPKGAGVINIEKIWILDPGPKAGKIFEE
ncbi:pyridoxamine 5'-phosphate oxidase family protein [Lentilactobacillus hilgardii]|uniref:pyridoxamine 5'-phosphate oxidase family protein n=1 Tax=Lentilactobacillus hilgardii TaxID=1588 RepID=UPI0021C2C8D1|nr:pyridoxamine 5'-phosphate oxidase family protein [Lentilactobacillus hilgardii]MCP9332685.1 pyridoxamine 5'-phosphate oxidase family protein [Lentilactobacillus hilgardii]MCP9349251.1 pyridoxamine 5'-phosphate oxidase family protein [Lentilactobacillus hilgardii]MCP9352120.1 pyridoxamine 5'-phosphate oxidase family protein [Lentilactobacillus hilgardii]